MVPGEWHWGINLFSFVLVSEKALWPKPDDQFFELYLLLTKGRHYYKNKVCIITSGQEHKRKKNEDVKSNKVQ